MEIFGQESTISSCSDTPLLQIHLNNMFNKAVLKKAKKYCLVLKI